MKLDLDELSLKATSLLRRAGLSDVPRHTLIGATLLGLALVLFGVAQFWPRADASFIASTSSAQTSAEASAESSAEAVPEKLVVDVEGAVVSPGLYELDAPARVGDAVRAAGGLASDAAQGAVNLAQQLGDGELVSIPSASAMEASAGQAASSASASTGGAATTGKVNINTASSTELQTLSGIGPSLAERIVDYREAHGRFSSVEEIQKVSGIGETRFANLKDRICV